GGQALRIPGAFCYNTRFGTSLERPAEKGSDPFSPGRSYSAGDGRVAKKAKHRTPPPPTGVELKQRLDRALLEGRFQTALDLAKQLYKRDPSPAHLAQLQNAYLG